MSRATVKKLHWRSKVTTHFLIPGMNINLLNLFEYDNHSDISESFKVTPVFSVSHFLSSMFVQVQESFVPLGGGSGELGLAIGGGADYGEFPFVTAAPGGGATVGDIILEIGGTPVLGMTLGDVRGVLNSCPHPIRIKTVSPGECTGLNISIYIYIVLFLLLN